MAEIKALDVKKLREQSGAGMMDCKKALTEANGDFEAASDWLRKKGLAAASKKSGRAAAEGLVGVKTSGLTGVAIELNAETDFVARNEKFQTLVNNILDVAINNNGDLDAILKAPYPGSSNDVMSQITSTIAIIGENMHLRRASALSVSNGVVVSYVHNAVSGDLGSISVLIALESSADKTKLTELGKKIAMHVAAMKPESLNIESLDVAKIDKEREIFSDQALKSGKPKEIVEKMVEGRIRKFYQEVVLLEQTFVMDNKLKISEVIAAEAKALGAEITLKEFVRYELGEGVEQKTSDFAAEVASMAK